MKFLSKISRLIIAVILLSASLLKLAGQNYSPYPQLGWLSAPIVQSCIIGWELGLAAWLMSFRFQTGSWFAAVLTFLSFAGASFYLGIIGQSSCGCFGAIKTSPWAAFTVDVLSLIALMLSRPPLTDRFSAHEWTSLSQAVKIAAISIVTLVLLLICGALITGSPEAAIARLRGDTISLDHYYVDFGTGTIGEVLEQHVTVVNWSGQSVRLIGGTSDCSCTVFNDLPQVITPSGRVTVRVQFRVPQSAENGQITRNVLLRTDSPSQPVVGFRVGCRVR